MKQPEGFVERGNEHLVCKLHRGLYGLKQAGREWWRHLQTHLQQYGLRVQECKCNLVYHSICRRLGYFILHYQAAIGSLMYLMTCTRTDLCYSVSFAASQMAKPKETDWMLVKKILRYLAGSVNYGLAFKENDINLKAMLTRASETEVKEGPRLAILSCYVVVL